MRHCIILSLLLFYLKNISSASFKEDFAKTPLWNALNQLSIEKIVNSDSLRAIENQQCSDHMDHYMNSLQSDLWAMQMFDASTKIPESVLMGLLIHLGNFDECLGIQNIPTPYGPLNGQHCLANTGALPSMDISLQMSYCIPSSCSAQDFQTIFNNYYSSNKTRTGNIGMQLSASDGMCHTKPKIKLLTAFSWYSNGKKLLSTETSGDTLHAIHGIRFLSICWVVLGHRYSSSIVVPSINAIIIQDFLQDFWRSFVTNANIAVDTFLFLSGLLVCYVFLKQMSKQKASFNIPLYYIHRYIRLTPPYAIMVLLTATLLRHAGSGPLYGMLGNTYASACRRNWWTSILYINNYVEPEIMCISQGWYLAVDMQLFILSPIILYPLWKLPRKFSLTFLGALIVGGLVTAFTVSYVEEFSPSPFIDNESVPSNFESSIYTALSRSTWSLGVGWVAYACVFGYGGPVNTFLSWTAFQPLSRLSYCVYLVHLSYQAIRIMSIRTAGYITDLNQNKHIHGKKEVVLYLPYFSRCACQSTQSQTQSHAVYMHTHTYSKHTNALITPIPDTISDIVISLFLAAVLSLCVESPIIVLERYLLGGGKSRNNKQKQQTVTEEQNNETKVGINDSELESKNKNNSDEIMIDIPAIQFITHISTQFTDTFHSVNGMLVVNIRW
ncbi:hypothetical protein C0J52_07353 [Blattella germanica]|nr:hypothetical protein C0J52_07353 [Blattella germanica]